MAYNPFDLLHLSIHLQRTSALLIRSKQGAKRDTNKMEVSGNVLEAPGQSVSGKSMVDRLFPKTLSSAAVRLVDSIKINSTSEKVWRGRRVMIKQRNSYSQKLAELSNVYFRTARLPIRFWAKSQDWQRWELQCFKMLNGQAFRVSAPNAKTVCADKLPGKNLWDHLNEGTITTEMMKAAGQELRRAHQIRSDEFRGPWSHGDAGTNNVIYDDKTGQARLIDFEIVHEKSIPAKSRHADDILVFLLDLMAVAPNSQWLSLSLAFLKAYDHAPVIAQLKHELALPTRIAWIWWGVRTNFSNPAKVRKRLEKIRGVTTDLEHYRAFAARRARQTRRASIDCQAIRPGIPKISSRTRAIKESAKAASPGMPSKLPIRT